jgi:hypothetical protein
MSLVLFGMCCLSWRVCTFEVFGYSYVEAQVMEDGMYLTEVTDGTKIRIIKY